VEMCRPVLLGLQALYASLYERAYDDYWSNADQTCCCIRWWTMCRLRASTWLKTRPPTP